MARCRTWAKLLMGALVACVFGLGQTAGAQTGACCASNGTCTETTAAACAGPNLFFGVGSVCTPNACMGACCSNAAPPACTMTAAASCTSATSIFFGVGSTCSPNPCTAVTGACCDTAGLCSTRTQASCSGTSVFQGYGSTCSPNPCTASVGPCCSTTGVCTLTLPTACALPSTFGVVGNTCSPNPCTIPTGACCSNAGVCSIKPASGTGSCGSGETYLGNNTTCSPDPCAALVGACCQTAGTCVSRTIVGCAATSGQTFIGVGTTCTPSPCMTGACCAGNNGNCSLTIASACVTTGTNSPTFLGLGTTCSPDPCAALKGACCPNGQGACFVTVASGCQAASFTTFNGPGTTCSPDPCAPQNGACCAAAGSCTITTALGCFGTFNGAGTVCTTTPGPCQALIGACCNAAGYCSMTIGTGCTGANSFRGAGTVCFPTPCAALQGACCNGAGYCSITTAGGCVQTNTFLGTGTVCTTSPCDALRGACCSSLGECSVTTAAGCGGSFTGAGTTCSPNNCIPMSGACCDLDLGTCAQTTALACNGPNQAWSGGTACNPGNPCTQPTGACCIGTFCSAPETASNCLPVGGVFFFGQTCSPTPCVRPDVVISQLYPSGGEDGAVYKYDYVELFNRGATDVTMTNWSIQYGAQSTQTFPQRVIFSGTIQAGHYFLIRVDSVNLEVGAELPVMPDWIATASFNMDVTAGRLALVSGSAPLPNGCAQPQPVNVVDFVGYGNPAGTNVPTCSEGGSPAGGRGGNIYAYYRKGNGCQDTDNNGQDFTQPLPPHPRNSMTSYVCGSTGSGACCAGESCSIAANAGSCGGIFYGEGTACAPDNPCLAARGACCDGVGCAFVLESECQAPSVFRFGQSCSPDPCTGACCNGASCVVTSIASCSFPSYFVTGGTCSPSSCNVPAIVQSGDIIYGASVTQNQDAVQQIRGAGAANPARVGTWTKYDTLQIMRLDNFGGVLHNAEGNLLGVNFGGQATGGLIYNLPTRTGDAAAGESLFAFTGSNAPFGLQRARLGGLSVSPNNDRLACIGYDAARLYVLSYNAGATVGTGAGASIDGGAQTDNNTFVFGFNVTQGTTWLDNDTIIMWVQSDVASVLKLYTVPVTGSGATIALGTPVERLAVFDNKPNSSRFTSIAYNPQLVPGYLFLGSSAFSGVTLNTTYIVDISGPAWMLVKSLNLGTSLQTEREIAIGPDRNLYLCQFAGSGTGPTDPLIDKLVLDADGNGLVTAAEIDALTDNSSENFYLKGSANTSSFNALDIAISLGACCSGSTCSIQPPSFCSGGNGIYAGNNTTCTPNPCGGACCRGSTCVASTQAACTGPNTVFAGANTTCNVFPSATTPCCLADFNHSGMVTVQDIFDFLGAYFTSSPLADINASGTVTVQDIFDFLTAYFGGGC